MEIFNFFWRFLPGECQSASIHRASPDKSVGFLMYRILEKTRSTHGQDGAVVLDIRQGRMFNLNFVGSRILKHVEGGLPQPKIVEEIVREFGVRRDLAENDVQEFLQILIKHQLVQSTD